MSKIRRVRARSQLQTAGHHIVVVKTEFGTFEVSGKGDIDGVTKRFSPVLFADMHGALAIALYWASIHNVPIVQVSMTNGHASYRNSAQEAFTLFLGYVWPDRLRSH